jgi:predicted extracellular nuclease
MILFLTSSLPLPTQAVSPDIVISQIYGGGGNQGAPYKNDFIELFNRGNSAVNITGWSVQYASADGSSWAKTVLAGTIPPGGYYLIQEGSGGNQGGDLPTPDAVGSINLSAGSGKIALVTNSEALSGSCPSSTNLRDLVGYGNSANCFEGNGSAPNLNNTTAALRKAKGCTDSDDNSNDFTTNPPSPRNSQSPTSPCGEPTAVTVTHLTATSTTTDEWRPGLALSALAIGLALRFAWRRRW